MKVLRQMPFRPITRWGKWSVGLQSFFLIGVGVAMVLVNVLGLLSYNDRWWDVTVPVLFLASFIGCIVGMGALAKQHESALLVYGSVGVGLCAFLFILLHSLFIRD